VKPELVMARKTDAKPKRHDKGWTKEDEAICKHCVGYSNCVLLTKTCTQYAKIKKLIKPRWEMDKKTGFTNDGYTQNTGGRT